MSCQTLVQRYLNWLTQSDPEGCIRDVTGFLVVHEGEVDWDANPKLLDPSTDPRARNKVYYSGGFCKVGQDTQPYLYSWSNWHCSQNNGLYTMATTNLYCSMKITLDGQLTVRYQIPEGGGPNTGIPAILQATVVDGTDSVFTAADARHTYTLSMNRNRVRKPIG